jgi:predicted phage terminase large subunit-like protein
MSTRLNNSETDAFVVIMQRLHEDDLTGHILTNSREDWVHLCLPMRYEKDRHCTTILSYGEDGEDDIKWTDPREEDGELLAPSRFSLPSVERLERALGAYNTAGQLQQRPSPKGGGIFKRDWWLPWDWDPEDPTSEAFKKYPRFDFIVASLDTAYGEKQENDYSACTIWGVFTGKSHPILPTMLGPDGSRPNLSPYIDKPQVMLAYAWNERLAFPQLVDKVVDTCRKFKVDRLLIEAKASGLSVAQELRTMQGSADWGVELINPGNMDKVARAHSVSHMLENKLVWCPYMGGMPRDWADPVITQCANFPKGAHDDLVDSVTQALRWLRDCGFVLRSEEIEEEVQGTLAYRQQSHAPLYPGSR